MVLKCKTGYRLLVRAMSMYEYTRYYNGETITPMHDYSNIYECQATGPVMFFSPFENCVANLCCTNRNRFEVLLIVEVPADACIIGKSTASAGWKIDEVYMASYSKKNAIEKFHAALFPGNSDLIEILDTLWSNDKNVNFEKARNASKILIVDDSVSLFKNKINFFVRKICRYLACFTSTYAK